ncbi:MAG: hypothetical protein L0Y80_08000 [Ignavibacteriae bacterium]|nr:hypothetical protein [Ignavibacteriota bacterium]
MNHALVLYTIISLMTSIFLFSKTPSTQIKLYIFSGLFAASICFFVIITITKIIAVSFAYYRVSSRRNHPKEIIVYSVFTLLQFLDTYGIEFEKKSFKIAVIKRIESIASYFEDYYPYFLKKTDPIAYRWLSTTTNKIASAFRSNKKLVILCKEANIHKLKLFLVKSLACILSGDLSKLEQAEPEKSVKTSFFDKLKNLALSLTSASLPFILFLIVQSQFELPSPYKEQFFIATLIWLIFSLLQSIDPTYEQKMIALKKIKDHIRV